MIYGKLDLRFDLPHANPELAGLCRQCLELVGCVIEIALETRPAILGPEDLLAWRQETSLLLLERIAPTRIFGPEMHLVDNQCLGVDLGLQLDLAGACVVVHGHIDLVFRVSKDRRAILLSC